MSKNIVKRIRKFNKGRNPELLKLKYDALKESPFRFFRGACHIYYEDIPQKSFILKSPHTWICGDLHLENFGSFKGDNGLAYFDMNDFDESMLGPCLLDVVRLCTSVFLAAKMIKAGKVDYRKLVRTFLCSYTENLKAGKIRFIEKETAKGVVEAFLKQVTQRNRKDLLAKRLDFSRKQPAIKLMDIKAIKATKKTRQEVKTALESWAKKNAPHPKFYEVLDVVDRAIGTGSIGIERHLVLINGRGAPDGYFMLDLKQALLPSPLHFLKCKQPKWENEAERLIATQTRVQAASPSHLHPIQIGQNWFVMKALQPLEDKIDFLTLQDELPKFDQLLHDMGAIVAWNNLRCGGRQGSAIADDLIRFGAKMGKLEGEIIDYAEKYSGRIENYWREFKKEDVI